MTLSTGASVTELINSEVIDPVILAGAMNAAVSATYIRKLDLKGKHSGTGRFTQDVVASISGSASTIADGSSVTAAEFAPTSTEITASQLAYSIALTDVAVEDNILEVGLFDFISSKIIRELSVSLDDDICALFSSLGNTVGAATTDLTIANMVQAKHKVMSAGFQHSVGEGVYILHTEQALHLDLAQQATVATTHGQYFVPNLQPGVSLVGVFQGNPIVATGNVDGNAGGTGVVGAYLVDGVKVPHMAPIALVHVGDAKLEEERTATSFSTEIIGRARVGVGIISASCGCAIETDEPA